MNARWIEIAIGALAIGYGIFTLYTRIRSPERLSKLASMKRVYGNKAGEIVHVIFYTIIPIVFGLILLISGILNANVFGN